MENFVKHTKPKLSRRMYLNAAGITILLTATLYVLVPSDGDRLVAAVRSEDTGEVMRLLKAGAKADSTRTELGLPKFMGLGLVYRTTPLIEAVRYRNVEAVEALLSAGANVDRAPGRWTALYGSLRPGVVPSHLRGSGYADQTVASAIVDAGPNPYTRVEPGHYVIVYAFFPGLTSIGYEVMRNYGQPPPDQAVADLIDMTKDYPDKFHRRYFLMMQDLMTGAPGGDELIESLWRDDEEAGSRLINDSAIAPALKLFGWTPASWAAANGADACLASSLAMLQDQIDAATTRGVTPLLAAVHSGSLECAQLVLRPEWLDHADEDGVTPLSVAVLNRDVELTRLLLDAGASTAIGAVRDKSVQAALAEWRADDPELPF